MSFRKGFEKTADNFTANAQQFEKGFNSGGPSLGQTVQNFKKAFGFGGTPKPPTPPAPPKNVSVGQTLGQRIGFPGT